MYGVAASLPYRYNTGTLNWSCQCTSVTSIILPQRWRKLTHGISLKMKVVIWISDTCRSLIVYTLHMHNHSYMDIVFLSKTYYNFILKDPVLIDWLLHSYILAIFCTNKAVFDIVTEKRYGLINGVMRPPLTLEVFLLYRGVLIV